MNKDTLTVIISFSLIGVLFLLYGVLTFKRNFTVSVICCITGLIFGVGINLMSTVR